MKLDSIGYDDKDTLNATMRKRYEEYIRYSEIPKAYRNTSIDIKNCSTRIQILYDNIEDIIGERYSYIFNVKNYSYCGNLSYLLIETYFKRCQEKEVLPSNILYVDTNLILDDFKKTIDNTSGNNISLTYSEETLFKNLESAPYVIWDRFSFINSPYDKQRIYNILLIRYRNGLGNIYFLKDAPAELARICDEEMYNILGSDALIDLSHESIKYDNEDIKDGIKW